MQSTIFLSFPQDESGSSPEGAKEKLLDKMNNVHQGYVKNKLNVAVSQACTNSNAKKDKDSRQREKNQKKKASVGSSEKTAISSNAKHKKHMSRRKLLKIRHAARREWNFVSHYTKGQGGRHTTKHGSTAPPIHALPIINNPHKQYYKSPTNGLSQNQKETTNSNVRDGTSTVRKGNKHRTAEMEKRIITKQNLPNEPKNDGEKSKVKSWFRKPSGEAQLIYHKKYRNSNQGM